MRHLILDYGVNGVDWCTWLAFGFFQGLGLMVGRVWAGFGGDGYDSPFFVNFMGFN
jgi:hypothetical protein